MSISLPFKQVDVFTSKPFKGNPVAVTNCMGIEESEIPTSMLQSIASWTNLSETTFIFKPSSEEYDYKLRIFTPTSELTFAGHPTIGSCRAFMEFSNRQDSKKLLQECALGIVELTVDGDTISFKAPKADIEDIEDEAIRAYENCLYTKFIHRPRLLHVGPDWVVCLVEDDKAAFDINPDFSLMSATNKRFGHIGIILGGKKKGSGNEYEMRAFAPSINVLEDPVCGSGSVALSKYLQETHEFNAGVKLKINQGGRINRSGRIDVSLEGHTGEIKYNVGGKATTLINGEIKI